jgi:RHS repeat-associated protein
MRRLAGVVWTIVATLLFLPVVTSLPVLASAQDLQAPIDVAIAEAHLPEPLVRTRSTTSTEDAALGAALAAFGDRKSPEDQSALSSFARQYPGSGWTPAVLTNIGLSDLHYGYFSGALDAWSQAWADGRSAQTPAGRRLIDLAVGELAQLDADLGRNQQLKSLLKEISDRPISGSATEAVQTASEELRLAATDPKHLFLCGPLALESLLVAEGYKPNQIAFLQWYEAGPNGTNLAELSALADKAKFAHRIIFRSRGDAVPVPSVVHWKLGHFAAIVGEADGRYHVVDPVFPDQNVWMSEAAIDSEASGYFMVPAGLAGRSRWAPVTQVSAAKIWGKGPTSGTPPGLGPSQDPQAHGNPNKGPNGPCPLCSYDIGESTVSLDLSDTPVGYAPPIGPSAKVSISYNQREDSQPANFSFFNVSPKWTLNWLSYVTDDPHNAGASVSRYLPGGGAYYYSGYQAATGLFAAQTFDGSILVLASQSPVNYRLQMGDGTVYVYSHSDGSTSYPRRIFLSQVIDPQGNALTLNYDGQLRLTSLTDATGRQTTLSYDLAASPLLVTKITDPFGRSAELAYDTTGRLSSITDIIGLTSSFTYDANSLVDALTTPYGTTSFAYTAPGTSAPPRFVQATDPLGYSEREEWVEPAPSIPYSDPTATVPTGMPMAPYNVYLSYRDSFHWDKNAYVVAGCTPTGGCDYTQARDRHFTHQAGNLNLKSGTIESVKYPLENRIWYNYPGQAASYYSGTFTQPIATGRVLDDGTTQLSQASFDTTGYFKPTQIIDPLGRTTSFTYSNHIDLSAISQTNAYGVQQTIAQFIYNTKHRPIYSTDAAGETSTYAYSAAGELTSVTNPLGEKTTYNYNATGDLISIVNADDVTAASFTYDAYDRIRTYTDSEGWTATYDYDAADRVTKITYPDGTSDTYVYDKLDLASFTDREGRVWSYVHDADRRLTSINDPMGEQTQFGYNPDGEMTSLTDPKGNVTQWAYDVEGRLTQKTYADNSTVTDTYESTTSRLKSVLDALGQTKQYSYAKDDRLLGVTYLNAVNPTPNVSFTYDPYFPRLTLMTDGTGTTQYSYNDVGSLGALQLEQETGPLPGGAISYAYDELGRLASRTVGGAGAETYGYDAIGRLIDHASDLGDFSFSYLGETLQPTKRQLAGSTLSTSWSYLPNSGDRRLAGISNVGLSSGQYSTYSYTTTPEKFITAISETSDSPPVYPTPGTQTASYNNLNQLTGLSGQALTYDADGNLLSDGQRDFSWDAENRLVGITYPGAPGKATTFTYDGFDRRTSITSTPAGGGTVTSTSYAWCGSIICEARDAAGAVNREYLAEGEYVPGSPGQPYYYGVDQLGSVRRVVASTSNAPAYDYDPYGNALTTTASLTDLGYAGMFYNAESELYLTQFRAYDAAIGRWLSRDPMGEQADLGGNLYPYVDGNPVYNVDPWGLDLPPGDGLTLPSTPAPGIDGGYGLGLPSIPAPSANGGYGLGLPSIPSPGANGSCGPGGSSAPELFAGTPNTGDPNSWYTNPGSGQIRFFGPDGYPALDIDSDHDHGGVGSPHIHVWSPNPGGFPIRSEPLPMPENF